MKTPLPWLLAALLGFGAQGCIYVRVTGDLDEELWHDEDDETGFQQLSVAVADCLADPKYDLDVTANPWRTEAEWTVRYASAGSDSHAAFRKAREAVLARIERKGGTVTGQHDQGPHDWRCEFRVDGEAGEASVRLVENADEDDERPHHLEVYWEEAN